MFLSCLIAFKITNHYIQSLLCSILGIWAVHHVFLSVCSDMNKIQSLCGMWCTEETICPWKLSAVNRICYWQRSCTKLKFGKSFKKAFGCCKLCNTETFLLCFSQVYFSHWEKWIQYLSISNNLVICALVFVKVDLPSCSTDSHYARSNRGVCMCVA